MAFTRKTYDENAYKQELYESTGTGRYQLLDQSTHRGNDTCFQETPEIRSNNRLYRVSDNNDMINAESDLFNLIRKDSKDPRAQYPYVKAEYSNLPKLSSCTKTDLARSYPLLDGNQFNREKEIQVPRFESLCLNPQQMNRIRSNNFIGLNTRLFKRDQHVPTVPKVKGVQGLPSLDQAEEFVSPIVSNLQGRSYGDLIAEAKQMKEESMKKNGLKEDFKGGCGCSGGKMRR